MNGATTMDLSVVVPVYNEEGNLRELHRRLQLTFLGVLGEYVEKAFAQVQGRPLYLVREEDGRATP